MENKLSRIVRIGVDEMFIYVFDEDTKDKMIALGHELLKESEDGKEFVFCINNNFTYSLSDEKCVVSDILTF